VQRSGGLAPVLGRPPIVPLRRGWIGVAGKLGHQGQVAGQVEQVRDRGPTQIVGAEGAQPRLDEATPAGEANRALAEPGRRAVWFAVADSAPIFLDRQ
jgi:hypothetical protein